MKNSTTSIDLMYLTNINNVNKSSTDFNIIDRKDLEFYKKRIFQMCKDLLRSKKITPNVDDAFDQFCINAIEHFKIIDKTEIIQNQYKNITSLPKQESTVDILDENPDEIMFKKIDQKNGITMDKFVINNVIKKNDMVIPKQKTFNLKDIKYQEKDVKIKSKSSAVAMENKKKKNKKVLKSKANKKPKQKKVKNVIDLNIN
tara:strand:- start:775 stop:1377 length:603 start_codon:yes stop_codon:yes gene_type:complete